MPTMADWIKRSGRQGHSSEQKTTKEEEDNQRLNEMGTLKRGHPPKKIRWRGKTGSPGPSLKLPA